MKKVMFLLAVAGMFAFAACNNQPAEEPATEMTEEQPVEDAAATDAEAEATEGVAEEATETPAEPAK